MAFDFFEIALDILCGKTAYRLAGQRRYGRLRGNQAFLFRHRRMRMTCIHELGAFGNQTIIIRSLFAMHDGVFPFSDFRFAHATHSDAMRNFKQRRNARCVVVGTFVVRSRFVQNAKPAG